MGFNPLAEQGIPLEKQIRNWSELNITPFDKRDVHPYTRARVIVMNGIEVEGVFSNHQFARHTDNWEIKAQLALVRRTSQQQQKAVNWLIPGDQTVLETTLAYEQVAIDLTAALAQNEPDPYLRQVLDFGLLEDFDHLYRYANLIDLIEGPNRVQEIIGNLTEVMPGRPTIFEHRHPFDEIRRHLDRNTMDPRSRMHSATIVAAEQQTMNFYMNVGPSYVPKIARGVYLEIGMIEEQHVTQYESLLDPLESWFQRELFHHYNECYLYWSFMNDEVDPRIRKLWELHLAMEIEHVRVAGELLKRYEGIDPQDILPKELPKPIRFHQNKQYIRQLLATQIDLTSKGTEFVPVESLPADDRYFKYQKAVNGGVKVPTELVIATHMKDFGDDFRLTTEGPHPVKEYRSHMNNQSDDLDPEEASKE